MEVRRAGLLPQTQALDSDAHHRGWHDREIELKTAVQPPMRYKSAAGMNRILILAGAQVL